MMFVISLMCLAFLFAPGYSAISQNVLDFTYFFNGDMDTREQYEAKTGHWLIEARMIPIKLKADEDAVAMYIEEAVNGTVQMLQIGIVKDGDDGAVHMQISDFTKYSDLKPFTYDYKSVEDVQPKDMTTDDDCVAIMTFDPTPIMTGSFPDCRYTMADGKHPRITATYTCESATAVFPSGPNDPLIEPYKFRLLRPKYPQVAASRDYIGPCDPRRRHQSKTEF
ncbi:hypothetical protein BsWGS_23113 [Bradybaena similaris]